MEILGIAAILLIVLFVLLKLGLFAPFVELSAVATRESTAYNRTHKIKVAKRYQEMMVDVDVKKVNANIETIDDLKFD